MIAAAPKAFRGIVVLTCAFAGWLSYRQLRADQLFRQDNVPSLEHAIHLSPDDARYYIRLAQLDEGHSAGLLETALRVAPFNSPAAIELGLRAELAGNYTLAEKHLLYAFDIDRTYTPRWTLANFYLRRGTWPLFWRWARSAAEMPADNISGLLQLCWRINPDADYIARALLNSNPSTTRQYLAFLLSKNEVTAAAGVASQLIAHGDPLNDRALLLSLLDHFILRNDGATATNLWHALIAHRWIVADPSFPNNAAFAREPLPGGFDWRLPSIDGVHTSTGPSGLEVEFSGKQAEATMIAEQTVPLAAGSYDFVCRYRTADIPPGSGLHWSVSAGDLVKSLELSSDGLTEQRLPFMLTGEPSLVRLQLTYTRVLGTARVSGILVTSSVAIRKISLP